MMKAKSLHCIAALGLGLALGQAADPVRERVAKGVATELPSLVSLYKHFHANPELSFMEVETAKRVTDTFAAWLGKGALIKRQPTMGGEDFGMYGRTKYKVSTFMFALGTVPTDLIRRFRATGKPLPMVPALTRRTSSQPCAPA